MKNRLFKLFTVVLCMVFIVAMAITVSAVEPDDEGSALSSVGTGSSSSQSISNETSSIASSTVSSEISSKDITTATSSDVTTSDETGSSDSEIGSQDSSGSEATSSGTTSSKTNRPIQSTGDGGSNFIDQDGDQLASQNGTTSQDSSSGGALISEEYVEDDDTDVDFFEGKADTVASNIYKIIWIPILISLLCIGALIYVNIRFRKKYPKTAKAGANGDKKTGPKRRKKSKKFKFTIEK